MGVQHTGENPDFYCADYARRIQELINHTLTYVRFHARTVG